MGSITKQPMLLSGACNDGIKEAQGMATIAQKRRVRQAYKRVEKTGDSEQKKRFAALRLATRLSGGKSVSEVVKP